MKLKIVCLCNQDRIHPKFIDSVNINMNTHISFRAEHNYNSKYLLDNYNGSEGVFSFKYYIRGCEHIMRLTEMPPRVLNARTPIL